MDYMIAFALAALFLAHGAYVASTFAAARAFGVPAVMIVVGMGPRLFERGLFAVRLFPISAFVRLRDSRNDAVAPGDAHAFDRQPRHARVLIHLAGPAALLAGAFALRGPQAWNSFVTGFGQIAHLAISWPSEGAELIRRFLGAVRHVGFAHALGSFLAKMAAVNLLPIPFLSGGLALFELLAPPPHKPGADALRLRSLFVGFWLWLLVVFKVAWAFVLALL